MAYNAAKYHTLALKTWIDKWSKQKNVSEWQSGQKKKYLTN